MKCLIASLVLFLLCSQALGAQHGADLSAGVAVISVATDSATVNPISQLADPSIERAAMFGSDDIASRSVVMLGEEQGEFPVASDSMMRQDLPDRPKPRLLPDNMSFVERSVWGETGLVREIGIASPLTPEVRKHELAVRRTMLTMHQIGGFVTLGLMGTAVYYGQMTLNNPQTRTYRSRHQTFVTATIFSYAATGLLAALSPPPLIRRDETSTTTIHKTLAWIHFAGMILTPIIGSTLHHSMSYDQQARFHQVSAYITTATLAASLIVITF